MNPPTSTRTSTAPPDDTLRRQRDDQPFLSPESRSLRVENLKQQQQGHGYAIEDQYHVQDPHLHYPPKWPTWHSRPRSPGLKWYQNYTDANLKKGRVLVIDYVRRDLTKDGMRKVAAQEIKDVEGLWKLYGNPTRSTEAILRLIHVQNAPWAIHFLLEKFNINSKDDIVGTDFGSYLYHEQLMKRTKRVLSGKTWKTQHDPWRGISKTAFGIDYLKQYTAREPTEKRIGDASCRIFDLNGLDKDDNPVCGTDVVVQRLSCYIQGKEAVSEIPAGIENPYARKGPHSYVPKLEALDNGNVIIIFENSQTGSIEDTLVAARGKWESRWRRLPFYLAYETGDISSDEQMARQCTKMILQDLWTAMVETWQGLLDTCNNHVAILEDKIYENPADESRAEELWTNSNTWLKVERLLLVHTDVSKELADNLAEMTDDPEPADSWLDSSPTAFKRLNTLVQENLVKPTTSLADLMYKSVGIRDSRHSLQLSYSMWRLSWITFIFLPLSFLTSFFGMNVTTFTTDDPPDLYWYFVAAVPMMACVFIGWTVFRHTLAHTRQTPYSRGIYEHLFRQLTISYPVLWSRSGPRSPVLLHDDDEALRGVAGWKWWLIRRWNAPEVTIRAGPSEDDILMDGLGLWSRLKRRLTRRWTVQIDGRRRRLLLPHAAEEGGEEEGEGEGKSRVSSSSAVGAPQQQQSAVGHESEVVVPMGPRPSDPGRLIIPHDLGQRISMSVSSRRVSGSGERPSSQGSGSVGRNSTGSVMVEEERPDWLSTSTRPE